MEDQGSTPKQQLAESLKNSTSVLVSTNNKPSLEEITSSIGLYHMLKKMGKKVAVVISGSLPDELKFLQPDTVVEKNTDSLRDFVIELDKEKADKLRYKVEDDLVRIFVTPYKTVLRAEDFKFGQGDFNVDTIVLLGGTKREELDPAITEHSRIMHDATVVTVNAGDKTASVGSVNWHESGASSVSEMLVSLSEALQSGLLDGDSSQAFLAGLIAATDDFSNEATSPKVMTMTAQLMAAGANLQLAMKNIAGDRKPGQPKLPEVVKEQVEDKDGNDEDNNIPIAEQKTESNKSSKDKEPEEKPKSDKAEPEAKITNAPAEPSEDADSKEKEPSSEKAEPEVSKKEDEPETGETTKTENTPASSSTEQDKQGDSLANKPGVHQILKDTSSADSDQADEPKHKGPEISGHKLLTHDHHSEQTPAPTKSEGPSPDKSSVSSDDTPPEPAQQTPAEPTSKPPEANTSADLEQARAAVENAVSSQEPSVVNNPIQALGAQPVTDSKEVAIDHEGNLKHIDPASDNGQTSQPPQTPA